MSCLEAKGLKGLGLRRPARQLRDAIPSKRSSPTSRKPLTLNVEEPLEESFKGPYKRPFRKDKENVEGHPDRLPRRPIVNPESWNIVLGGFMLGFPLLYFKGMRLMMFQLSSLYCKFQGLNSEKTTLKGTSSGYYRVL